MFSKYHYLDDKLHSGCTQYIGIINDQIVAHCGVIQFPMHKGMKRIHRLVVLPDYQGIGIGTKFVSEIAKLTSRQGYEVSLITTTPSLVNALKAKPNWILARYGRCEDGNKGWSKYGENVYKTKHLQNTTSANRITYSFWYKDI